MSKSGETTLSPAETPAAPHEVCTLIRLHSVAAQELRRDVLPCLFELLQRELLFVLRCSSAPAIRGHGQRSSSENNV